LSRYFMPHQVHWIEDETTIHAQRRQVFALAEKSIRIGWTHADAFKNVRKRLRFPNRDYLFVSKDYPSALEYLRVAVKFAEIYDFARAIVSRGEEYVKVPRLDERGRPTGFTEEVKIGVLKFDNGSRILAFSAHPQAMAVFGGDVGLDEFAKHPNAELLWETAQGRVTWGFDLAVWSAHDGEDTLFYQFAQEARRSAESGLRSAESLRTASEPNAECGLQTAELQNGVSGGFDGSDAKERVAMVGSETNEDREASFHTPHSVFHTHWNLYYRVTMPDAIELGLLDFINRARGTQFTAEQFLSDCQARAGTEQIYQQAYLCNPVPGGAGIVEWSAIERCRADYPVCRVHLEAEEVGRRFGQFNPEAAEDREEEIGRFLRQAFSPLISPSAETQLLPFQTVRPAFRLGFDVAASGQGDLAVIYIDEVSQRKDLWLRGLFSCRTDDWHFLKTVLYYFLKNLRSVQAAGDETGLGRQICWEAASRFSSRFTKVNFSSRKHDLGFALMNQLAVTEKHLPRSEADVASDYFALRKKFLGNRWVFSEGRNAMNPASHCDLAWAGALASFAHAQRSCVPGARVG
jgi:phage FluMu gp28-like protein